MERGKNELISTRRLVSTERNRSAKVSHALWDNRAGKTDSQRDEQVTVVLVRCWLAGDASGFGCHNDVL